MTPIQPYFRHKLFVRVMFVLAIVVSQLFTQNDFVNDVDAADIDSVDNIRIWHSPNNTRIVFDVSSNVRQSMFTLQNPLRLVVDIQNARFKSQLPVLDPQNKHIARVRSGTPQDDILRFVFELKKDLLPSNFVLSPNELYGHRLVIDLDEKLALASNAQQPIYAPLSSSSNSTSTEQTNQDQGTSLLDQHLTAQDEVSPSSSEPVEPQLAPPAPVFQEVSAQQNNIFVVAIDAGHGGEDPGAKGYRGSREKDLTLSIAKRLKKLVDADPNMRAELIRTGDYYIKLHQRRQLARERGADIFVSIHADAFTRISAKGFSVFALSQRGATSAMASALAAKENASDRIGGVSLADKDALLAQVLVDLSMTNTISESVNLGGRVLKELGKLGKLHSKRVEQAGFAVLKSPDMPSILIETGFITNPEEERLLKSARYQKKVAKAIYTAITDYHEQTPYVTYQRVDKPVNKKPQKNTINSTAKYHIVKRGDSLSKISARYNVTINSLKRLNKLRGNNVVLGQKIKLPSTAVTQNKELKAKKKIVHKVKRGDNLSEIAKRYGVTIKAIVSLNKLKTRTIYVGQRIKIP